MKLIIISTSTMCVYILTTFNEHLEHCLKWIGDNFRKIKRKNTVYVKKMLTDIRAYIKKELWKQTVNTCALRTYFENMKLDKKQAINDLKTNYITYNIRIQGTLIN